ncbi:hypothetical protein QF037_009833 [Streptomyces canus]|nr:hypothetical protein [Streptomyces canus]
MPLDPARVERISALATECGPLLGPLRGWTPCSGYYVTAG